MQIGVWTTLTAYLDGRFWVGPAGRVGGGRYGVARIVLGAEPPAGEDLRFAADGRGYLRSSATNLRSRTSPRRTPSSALASQPETPHTMNRATSPVHAPCSYWFADMPGGASAHTRLPRLASPLR